MFLLSAVVLLAAGPDLKLIDQVEEGVPEEEPVESGSVESAACVAGQVIVPPFNNSPAAMDQSRIAATAVMRENARKGGKSVRICQTSSVSPELSGLKHGNEIPVDPEYEPEGDPGSSAPD